MNRPGTVARVADYDADYSIFNAWVKTGRSAADVHGDPLQGDSRAPMVERVRNDASTPASPEQHTRRSRNQSDGAQGIMRQLSGNMGSLSSSMRAAPSSTSTVAADLILPESSSDGTGGRSSISSQGDNSGIRVYRYPKWEQVSNASFFTKPGGRSSASLYCVVDPGHMPRQAVHIWTGRDFQQPGDASEEMPFSVFAGYAFSQMCHARDLAPGSLMVITERDGQESGFFASLVDGFKQDSK